MMIFKEKLQKLELIWKEKQYPILNYFDDGLSKKEVEDLFNLTNLKPTPELIELYQWKRRKALGVPSGKVSFFLLGTLFPLDIMIDFYNSKYYFDDFKRAYLFPICSSDMYAINLNPKSKHYGKVYFYSAGLLLFDPILVFESLDTMFDTILECYENEVCLFDENGIFRYSKDYYKIGKKHNPNAAYWDRY